LNDAREAQIPWKKWGPYLSERQWGTVREDYSNDGNAWDYFTHDQARSREEFEYELLDTGAFNDDRYFDVFVEYAKESPEDVLARITVHNRGSEAARLRVLPTLWFRNTWSWGKDPSTSSGQAQMKPSLREVGLAPKRLAEWSGRASGLN
jgi:hypothetical protein